MSSLGTSFINKSKGKPVGPKPPPARRNKTASSTGLSGLSFSELRRPSQSPAPRSSTEVDGTSTNLEARQHSSRERRPSRDSQNERTTSRADSAIESPNAVRRSLRTADHDSHSQRRNPRYGPWNNDTLEHGTGVDRQAGEEASAEDGTQEYNMEEVVVQNRSERPDVLGPSEGGAHGEESQLTSKKPRKVRSDKGVRRGPRSSSAANPQISAVATTASASIEADPHAQAPSQSNEAPMLPTSSKKRVLRSRLNPKEGTVNVQSNENNESAPPAAEEMSTYHGETATDDEPRPKKRRVTRRSTPEEGDPDAQNSGATMMFELIKDKRTGPVSQLEAAMRKVDWKAVKRQQLQAEEAALRDWEAREASRKPNGASEDEDEESQNEEESGVASRNPKLRMVNGQIQFDNSSLTVDRHAETAAAAEDAAAATVAFEESDLTNQTNTRSFLEQKRRDPRDRFIIKHKADPWTIQETSQFYNALRMFGTDFMIISKMFPGKTRRQVKNKFVREERESRELVDKALLNETTSMDIEFYAHATGVDEEKFKDPTELMEQLEREKEGQRETIERENRVKQEEQAKKRDAAKQRQEQTKREREERKRRKQERRERQKNKNKKRRSEDDVTESVENNDPPGEDDEVGNAARELQNTAQGEADGEEDVADIDAGEDAVDDNDLYDEGFSDGA